MFTSQMMKRVHEIAKELEGHYHARLSLAFSIVKEGDVKEMIINKKGFEFKVLITGSEIEITCNKMQGYAKASISNLKERTPFSYSCLSDEKGKINGFIFTQEQIDEIKTEFKRQKTEIKNFLNKNEFRIECLSYSYFYVEQNEKARELKEINEKLFNSLSSTFIKMNKKLLKEVDRIVEAYSNDIIYYVIEEKEIVKTEYVRDLNEQENKKYSVNDRIAEFVVSTETRLVEDIDYNEIYKTFKVLNKEIKKTIKISNF